jgi:hypothetical protein
MLAIRDKKSAQQGRPNRAGRTDVTQLPHTLRLRAIQSSAMTSARWHRAGPARLAVRRAIVCLSRVRPASTIFVANGQYR